jgi:hypothetical protein
MLDLRTYLLKSGTGGHSVFNMYFDKSGIGGHGGMVLFKTYFVMSTSLHGGHTTLAISPQFLQLACVSKPSHFFDANPSIFKLKTRAIMSPTRMPTIKTRALFIRLV